MHPMTESNPDPFHPEALDEHRVALAALARRMFRDAAAAEDLVQSTFVRALERPPRAGRGIGAWLRRVLWNEARQSVRAARRRQAREAAVARATGSGAANETAEAAAKFDAHWLLMNAVRGLDEAYREIILLRFFADLPPRKIAVQLGIPVKTVDTRIQRALAKLRADLDAAMGGDRDSWLFALLPLCPPLAPAAAAIGSLVGVLTLKAVLFTGIAVIGLAAAAWWSRNDADLRASDLHSPRARVDASAAPAVAAAPLAIRSVVPGDAALPPALAPAGQESENDALFVQPGRLIDLEGHPIAGARLVATAHDATGERIEAITGADGRFQFRGEQVTHAIESGDDRIVLLGDVEYDAAPVPAELVVLGAPVTRVRAQVVDETSHSLEGADLVLSLAERVRVLLGADAARTRFKRFEAKSDREGGLAVDGVPAIRGLVANVSKPGFSTETCEIDASAGSEPRFVLRRTAKVPALLKGVVYDARGGVLAGVRVGFGGRPATTDHEGRFAFEYDAASPPDRLIAVAKGFLPASIVHRADDAAWPLFVELRISETPRTIAGTVLDEQGRPLAGAEVWIAESTPLAAWNDDSWTVENEVRGGGALRIGAYADAIGRFQIEGLLDRDYDLLALDLRRAWIVEGGRVRGGAADVVIRFPAAALRQLSGRVVDHRGVGMAGASVTVQCKMLAFRDATGVGFYDTALGSSATTDADGRFLLEEVPSRDTELVVVRGDDLLGDHSFPIPERTSVEPLVFTVSLRCELRVESTAAEFALLDSAGNVLLLLRNDLKRVSSIERARLVNGQSEVVAASDAARWLALYDANGNETRREIMLTPGRITVLR